MDKSTKHLPRESIGDSYNSEVKKAFCYQKLCWPFTVKMNCSSDLKIHANSRPLASNTKSFSQSLEQFFLIVCQNNFGNKIPNSSRRCISLMKHIGMHQNRSKTMIFMTLSLETAKKSSTLRLRCLCQVGQDYQNWQDSVNNPHFFR